MSSDSDDLLEFHNSVDPDEYDDFGVMVNLVNPLIL